MSALACPVHGDPASKIEHTAKRDQAWARLFERSGWMQEELAEKEGKSQSWIQYRLRFGRFLHFTTTVVKADSLPANLTERRFRELWERTDKDAPKEALRFQRLAKRRSSVEGGSHPAVRGYIVRRSLRLDRRRPRMLPASDLAEIISSLAALNLEPQTTTAVIGAILVPLLRSSGEIPAPPDLPRQRAARRPQVQPRKARQKRKKYRPRVAAATDPNGSVERRTTGKPTAGRANQHQRALAALKANPGVSLTRVAEIAKCSRSTVSIAAHELGAETHKQARKQARKPLKPESLERRERAARFLRDELAHGPKRISDVEEAAEKAHIELDTLRQARGDLGIVTSRANAGGVHAVQWSLPA